MIIKAVSVAYKYLEDQPAANEYYLNRELDRLCSNRINDENDFIIDKQTIHYAINLTEYFNKHKLTIIGCELGDLSVFDYINAI